MSWRLLIFLSILFVLGTLFYILKLAEENLEQDLILDSAKTNSEEESSSDSITTLVKMLEYRTYGRVFLENLNPASGHSYLLAEPSDVVSEGAARYSPMTQEMRVGMLYEVEGIVTQSCFDKYEFIKGNGDVCIAWINISSVKESQLIEDGYGER